MYKVYSSNPCAFTCHSFYYAINAVLVDHKDKLSFVKKDLFPPLYIDVCYSTCDGIMTIDTITINDNLIASSIKGQFDLKSGNDLVSFLTLYETMSDDKKYEYAGIVYTMNQLNKLNESVKIDTIPLGDHSVSTNNGLPTKLNKTKKVYTLNTKPESTKDILKGVLDKIKQNTSSSIQESENDTNNSQANNTQNQDNINTTNESEFKKKPSIEVKKVSCENNINNETDNLLSNDSDKLKKKIDELEKAKNLTDEAIDNFSNELTSEKNILENYITDYNSERSEHKNETNKTNREINEFISDRESTYKLVYMQMFGNNKKKKDTGKEINLYSVPPLFVAKFPIFLYMDGKDLYGNSVRDRLLDREDAFNIYKLLFDTLTNSEAEVPEDNEEELEIVNDFINFVPPSFQPATVKDIMDYKNKKDKLNPYSLHSKFDDVEAGPNWDRN
jgi:hypothetical protein